MRLPCPSFGREKIIVVDTKDHVASVPIPPCFMSKVLGWGDGDDVDCQAHFVLYYRGCDEVASFLGINTRHQQLFVCNSRKYILVREEEEGDISRTYL